MAKDDLLDNVIAAEQEARLANVANDAQVLANESEVVRLCVNMITLSRRLDACAAAMLKHELDGGWEMEDAVTTFKVLQRAAVSQVHSPHTARELLHGLLYFAIPFVDVLIRAEQYAESVHRSDDSSTDGRVVEVAEASSAEEPQGSGEDRGGDCAESAGIGG